MTTQITLNEVKDLAQRLSRTDKIRLIAWMTPQIKQATPDVEPIKRKSLRGLWRGLDLTEADIDQSRREMWRNFPRQDI